MAIPIIDNWESYFQHRHEGLGSSYERVILNLLLSRICSTYKVERVLETPSFGFTGLSGINSMFMAGSGAKVFLEDHNLSRIEQIRSLWSECKLPLEIAVSHDYRILDYADKSMDLLWNFSALWFVKDLAAFISESSRVASKAILICVPNSQGLGFRMQSKTGTTAQKSEINLGFIDPHSIITLYKRQAWDLVESGYIDCPPWPDIGMAKEDFVARFLSWLLPLLPKAQAQEPQQTLSILPFYQGLDEDFPQRMLRFYPFERFLPIGFKRLWAHHYYLLFVPR